MAVHLELISVFAILTGGVFLLRATGMHGWLLPPLGFVTGIAIMIIIGNIQVLLGIPTTHLATLWLTILIPFGIWAWFYRKGLDVSFRILPTALTAAIVAAVVFSFHFAGFINVTPDSYRYAQMGSLLESGNIAFAQPSFLQNRLLAVPLLHMPANMANKFFLYSISPVLALSTTLIVAGFCHKGIQNGGDWTSKFLIPSAALLLITNHFFIFNAFYVNGHLLYSALLTLIAGCAWLYARNADVSKPTLLVIILIAIPAIVLTRPEGALHAGIILLPILVSSKFSRRHKSMYLTVLGLTIINWHGFLWIKYMAAGESVPASVTGVFFIGIAAVAFIPVLFSDLFEKVSHRMPSTIEIALWLALATAAIMNPPMFYESTNATFENIIMGKGLWGYSLVIIGFLFIGLLALTNAPERLFLRYPVTTFIPLGLLLAFLRAVPYRVSPLDSLNRMFLHILPLAIVFIISSAATNHRLHSTNSQ